MLYFHLNSLSSKEIFKDVLVKLIHGEELTLNYFELKNKAVKIPFHEHPVEHIVVVLDGEVEFMFENQRLILKKKDCLFVPAKTRHTACVINGPVKALEIYPITKDKYYEK